MEINNIISEIFIYLPTVKTNDYQCIDVIGKDLFFLYFIAVKFSFSRTLMTGARHTFQPPIVSLSVGIEYIHILLLLLNEKLMN